METASSFYGLKPQKVMESLATPPQGLADKEATERGKTYGLNQISRKHSWWWLKLALGQFGDVLVWMLLVAAALAFLFHEVRDMTIILIIVGINATVGFFQEFKTERTLASIRKLTAEKTIVFRDGEQREIETKRIVPGDVVFVGAGGRIYPGEL